MAISRRKVISESRNGIATTSVGMGSAEGRRIVGVDIARVLAIVGMLVAHAVPGSTNPNCLSTVGRRFFLRPSPVFH